MTRPTLLASAGLLALGLAMPALAEDTTAAQHTAEATMLSQHKLDGAFAQEAARGGVKEAMLGQLAVQNAGSEDVKAFGQRMIDDHSAANETLKDIAEDKGLHLPAGMDEEAKGLVDRLGSLSGAAFDQAYMEEMVRDHEKDVAAFQTQAEHGQDEDWQEFAADTLPTLEEHLQEAKAIASAVGVVSAEGMESLAAQDQLASEGRVEATTGADASEGTPDEIVSASDEPAAEVAVSDGDGADSQPETAAGDDTAAVARAEAGDLKQMTAGELIGQDIRNAEGDSIGEIEDIVLSDDEAVFALVDVGGFLGIGEKRVAVPFDHLQSGPDGAVMMANATQAELEALPDWEEGAAYAQYPRDRRLSGEAAQ